MSTLESFNTVEYLSVRGIWHCLQKEMALKKKAVSLTLHGTEFLVLFSRRMGKPTHFRIGRFHHLHFSSPVDTHYYKPCLHPPMLIHLHTTVLVCIAFG